MFKPRLILFPSKGALLDLDYLGLLEHLEAVSAGGKHDHVARHQDACIDIIFTFVIDIDLDLPFFDEQDLLGVKHFPLDLIVYVRGNPIPGRPVHVGKLLGKVIGREEMDTRLAERVLNDDSQ